MKIRAQRTVLTVFVVAIAWACGDGGLSGSFESDSSSDTSGWPDAYPTSDAMSESASDPWWPSEDAASDPVPDASSEDAIEETEPPPEDVCDAEITEPQILYMSADDSNS
ncbi:MAG: hypothetical protein JRG91_20005, partial [Deltaproteobacteria bacterium]|nr:hypothetical protein [Deltaproteobacteria bacterium]